MQPSSGNMRPAATPLPQNSQANGGHPQTLSAVSRIQPKPGPSYSMPFSASVLPPGFERALGGQRPRMPPAFLPGQGSSYAHQASTSGNGPHVHIHLASGALPSSCLGAASASISSLANRALPSMPYGIPPFSHCSNEHGRASCSGLLRDHSSLSLPALPISAPPPYDYECGRGLDQWQKILASMQTNQRRIYSAYLNKKKGFNSGTCTEVKYENSLLIKRIAYLIEAVNEQIHREMQQPVSRLGKRARQLEPSAASSSAPPKVKFDSKLPHKRRHVPETLEKACELESTHEKINWSHSLYKDRNKTGDICFKFPDGSEVRAHKFILINYPYFNSLLNGPFRESVKNEKGLREVELEDSNPRLFKALLYFLYTGHVTVAEDQIGDLLIYADRYLVEKLMRLCSTAIYRQVPIASMLALFEKFNQKSFPPMQQQILKFICLNASECLFSASDEALSELSLEGLITILQQDLLALEEEMVIHFVLKWLTIKAQEFSGSGNQEEVKEKLLPLIAQITCHIRLPLIARDALCEKWVETEIYGYRLFKEEDILNACDRKVREKCEPRQGPYEIFARDPLVSTSLSLSLSKQKQIYLPSRMTMVTNLGDRFLPTDRIRFALDQDFYFVYLSDGKETQADYFIFRFNFKRDDLVVKTLFVPIKFSHSSHLAQQVILNASDFSRLVNFAPSAPCALNVDIAIFPDLLEEAIPSVKEPENMEAADLKGKAIED